MENKPKEEEVPPIHTDGDPPPPKCPEGYIWDDKLKTCVLDVG